MTRRRKSAGRSSERLTALLRKRRRKVSTLREGNYARRATVATKAQRIIGIVGLILLAVVLIYFTKFYSLL